MNFNTGVWVSFKFGKGLFALSNDGKLYSYQVNRLMKITPPNKAAKFKQYSYAMWDGQKYTNIAVGKLVLTFFKTVGWQGTTVWYKDRDYSNHHVSNLEWITYGELTTRTRLSKKSHIDKQKFGTVVRYRFYYKENGISKAKYFKYS